MLARGPELLREAREQGRALGAFSTYNLEWTQAICRAAEAEATPVILQAGSSAFRWAGRRPLAALALAAAEGSSARIGVHLDHGSDLDEIAECLTLGYSSVMIDGSALPFEDNVAITRRTVELARRHGAWVEGELGGVRGDEERSTRVAAGALTDPDAAARFVERTGVDALAVAVGTVHGMASQPAELDVDRLAAIDERVDVPLVLHGASGVPADVLADALAHGVAKVNVNTELRRAYRDAVRAARPNGDDVASILGPGRAALEAAVRHKIRQLTRSPP